MEKERKRVLLVLVTVVILFFILIAYLTWFQVFKSSKVKNNPYNQRNWLKENKIVRGSIYDRNGVELAYTEVDEDIKVRKYPYDNLYSHIIGYNSRDYGSSGLELEYNEVLLGLDGIDTIKNIKDTLLDNEIHGNSINLTLDHKMQSLSRELLSNKKGAIVSMNPKTGEIYSLVSTPDFSVNRLEEDWESIVNDSDGVLINRALNGLYPPGSTFKIISSAAILENNMDLNYNCRGQETIDGYTFNDYARMQHGQIDLNQALIKSCNTYFINKSYLLGANPLGETSKDFLLNKKIEFDLDITESKFDYKNISKTELASAGIGQGKILMTPINMLLGINAVANNGVISSPKLIKNFEDYKGNIYGEMKVQKLSKSITDETAKKIAIALEGSVTEGTSRRASINGIRVAGKTGTAENSSGKSHAWFVGYAPIDNPKISVVVLIEEAASTGGETAAPLAKRIIENGLEIIK